MERQDYENLMKDCPRCGGSARIFQRISWDTLEVDYYPGCKKCGLSTLQLFSTEILAVEAWNKLEVSK